MLCHKYITHGFILFQWFVVCTITCYGKKSVTTLLKIFAPLYLDAGCYQYGVHNLSNESAHLPGLPNWVSTAKHQRHNSCCSSQCNPKVSMAMGTPSPCADSASPPGTTTTHQAGNVSYNQPWATPKCSHTLYSHYNSYLYYTHLSSPSLQQAYMLFLFNIE
jgi:hypothetical protein